MVICTVIFIFFGLFGARSYFDLMSDTPLTVEFGTQYIRICCLLSLGIFIEILGERLLQASGRTIYTLVTQGTGAVVNIILDPILIHGWFGLPALGVAGAAWATVIGQWAAAFLALYFNEKHNPEVQFGRRYAKLHGPTVKQILTVGSDQCMIAT